MSKGNEKNKGGGDSSEQVGAIPFSTKAGYVGTGVLIGLIIYPFVRRAVTKAQPQFEKFFEGLTGKAEEFAEKASDLMAKAKAGFASEEAAGGHSAQDGHDHKH